MATTKLAVIGVGLIGQEHCKLIAGHPGADLVAVADPSPESKVYADDFGVPHFEDYARMLEDAKPDAAIVALPNVLHEAVGLACLRLGIPCLIEKPITDTVASAASLVAAEAASGVPILVGHHRRHSPDIREAREQVRGGAIGDLVGVNGMWLADKPAHYFDVEWRRRPGGGPLLINLIHDIDCLRFIAGDIVEVQAFTGHAIRGFEVEDTASVTIRFENGALGCFLLSDAAASPYSWEVSSGQALYFPHQPEDCFYFAGRKGALAVPSMNLWRHEKPDGDWQDPLVRRHVMLDGSRAYRNQLDHFLAVVAGKASPIVGARDATMTLATILAIETAAREKRTVRVEEMGAPGPQ